MSAVAVERRRLGAPEAWRFATERVARTAGVLLALWALWEALKWVGETTGFRLCRDNQDECLQHVLDSGPTLGEGHQRWQLNEINDVIWPAANGIGVMNPDDFDLTAQIAQDYDIIKNPASDDAYTTEHAEAAVAALEEDGVDVNGDDWEKAEVEVTEGGN